MLTFLPMKPKDFKIPVTFENRKVLIYDGYLYIPVNFQNYENFKMPSFKEIFSNENPVNIEYCSGNGDWVANRAINNPLINWVAVEKRFDRVRKIWAKVKKHQLKNLFIVFGDATLYTQYYIIDSSIANIYVNFPDPWPKKKHEKHRLVNNYFIKEISRILEKDGKAIFATDHFDTSERIINLTMDNKNFITTIQKPFYTNDFENYGNSFFQNLFISQNKKIYYMKFANQKLD